MKTRKLLVPNPHCMWNNGLLVAQNVLLGVKSNWKNDIDLG